MLHWTAILQNISYHSSEFYIDILNTSISGVHWTYHQVCGGGGNCTSDEKYTEYTYNYNKQSTYELITII